MSRWIVDASLSLGWFLKDEEDRAYNLEVLAGLKENEIIIPFFGHTKFRMALSWLIAASGLRSQSSRK